ncbi:HIT-like protein [Pluteus cervinus]|uniref:HIT-like protein n=1 Tax=Pluteus cervinus TaxID=181527 RepID=A0ACD3B6C1_9AGAR|nr:HIT-like protein [Pluteus cervinus]
MVAPNAPNSDLPIPGCRFCNVSEKNGFDVVWENEIFIAFRDYRPAATHHILLIPKRHISSVRTLLPSDVELLRNMQNIGHGVFDRLTVESAHGLPNRMGFHIPPFNSVDHLHLHLHALPYLSYTREKKYPVATGSTPHHKGLSWFVEIGQAIGILERGGSVGILPC